MIILQVSILYDHVPMTKNPKSYSGTASLYDQITGLYDIDTNSYADKQQFFG